MKNIKVVIPLKTNSQRVPNKNLRNFFGEESLFDIKVKQLFKLFAPCDILISSENPDVEKLAQKYGINFHLRNIELTKATAKENQIVQTLTQAVEDKTCDIMWVQVTQPLFNEFDKIIEIWNNLDENYDSLAVVKKVRHHLLDSNGNPVNFNFGYWHKISQDLPNLFEVTWSAFIMSRQMLNQTYYQIGRNPYLYVSDAPLVDIDNLIDFDIASILYRYYNNENPSRSEIEKIAKGGGNLEV